MGSKNLVLLYIILFLISCSTVKPKNSNETPQLPSHQNNETSNTESSTESDSTLPETEQEIPVEPKKIALWVESLGSDFYFALGFIQSLEKRGIKPELIIGTGTGCWVALEWASAGNANAAEWQLSKIQSFDKILGGSLLSKVGLANRRNQFKEESKKFFKSEAYADLKNKVDCPFFTPKSNKTLRSFRSWSLRDVLWYQVPQNMFFEKIKDEPLDYYSGILGFGSTPLERKNIADSLTVQQNLQWIVLKTYNGALLNQSQQWPEFVMERKQFVAGGNSFVQDTQNLQLNDGFGPLKLNNLKSFEQKRKFLLWGRKIGEKFEVK